MASYINVINNWNNGQGRLTAYLHGFDVGSHVLRSEHKTWLQQIASDILTTGAFKMATKTNAFCCVWLLGTASRTAPNATNDRLSKDRANEVKKTLDSLLAKKVACVIKETGLGETIPFLQGKRDGTEDPLDRSVLLVAEWHTIPNSQPPIIKRPDPATKPIEAEFHVWALRHTVILAKKWEVHLIAKWSAAPKPLYRGWQFTVSGLAVSPEDVVDAPPGVSQDGMYAGPAKIGFPSAKSLDGLDNKKITMRTQGSTLVVSIKSALANGKDLDLRMPSTTEWELSQVGGGLGKGKPLSEREQAEVEEALRMLRGEGIPT